MVKYPVALVFVLALCIGTSSTADMIDDSGLAPWETCALCHGLYGDSPRSKFPKLAGQKAEYLANQIRAFQTGGRTNDNGQMQSMVESLTNDDIEQIIEWFASQPAPKPSSTKPSQVALNDLSNALGGEPDAVCGTCHQAASFKSSEKVPAATSTVPFLHAQHSDYLVRQMTDFKTGDRRDNLMHRPLLQPLNSEQIKTLSDHYSSSPRVEN